MRKKSIRKDKMKTTKEENVVKNKRRRRRKRRDRRKERKTDIDKRMRTKGRGEKRFLECNE